MNRRPSSLPALALALLATGALTPFAAPALAEAPVAAASTATVPPIPYTLRTLKNGLQVYAVRDTATSNVAVQVWYGVGSVDDPQGRSGFAHLFEHMMFKASRDMPSEYLDRLTEDVGGNNNASTWDDLTNYYEVIPANHVERLLWAEAERMSALKVDEASFKSERDVVKEELRQSYLANPYGRLNLILGEASYTSHPYRRSTIGSIADLDAATIEDVRAFHDTYYRPANAALIVVGNFDQAKLDATIDRYFGEIQNPEATLPRVTAVEPPRTGPKVVLGYGPNVPLPAVAMTFQGPAAASADAAPLRVLDAILSAGEASRLNHDLVYERQIAQSVGSDAPRNRAPGLFMLQIVMAGGKTVEEGSAALLDEVKRVREAQVSAPELARAKNQLLAHALGERETIQGRAFELGMAIRIEGDAARANSDIAALQAVSAADVQRVAVTYLDPERRVEVRYADESARPRTDTKARDAALAPSLSVAVADRPASISAPLPPADLPTAAPAPSASPKSTAPVIAEKTLPNGLRVIVARTGDLPLVTAALAVPVGGAADPANAPGLASMMTGLLPQGTTSRSATQIAEAVEAAGGSLDPATGFDSASVSLTVLADQLGVTLPILADVAEHPAFAGEEIERRRHQALDDLTVSLKSPRGLVGQVAPGAAFGSTGYGHPLGGTVTSIKGFTRAALTQSYGQTFAPKGAVLVMTGGIAPQTGFALAEQAFGGWTGGGAKRGLAKADVAKAHPLKVIAIDLPGSGQAAVTVISATNPRSDPDHYAAVVANDVLGGGFSARLNEEIRIKRGLSYGAGSRLDARRDAGLFTASAQTKNESAAQVADLLLDEVKGLAERPLAASELEPRKAYLVGSHGRAVEQSAGLASEIGSHAILGVPLSDIASHDASIQAVTAQAARAAAPSLTRGGTTLIVAGDARLFLAGLKAKFPALTVIPAASLGAPVGEKAPSGKTKP